MASRQVPTAGGAVQRRFPDFFIVGHHKSGTTALYEMLSQHPQVYMSDLKEPRYFEDDMRHRFQSSVRRAVPETLDDYLSLFAAATPEQRIGDASPSYLLARNAASRIADVQPAARIVAILREPASFLRSLHLMMLRRDIESKNDLRKAMSLEAARRGGRRIPRSCNRPQLLQYSEHVRYVDQLRRYHARFPPEQVLVLVYDDFRLDNEGTLRSVLRLLDVDEEYPINVLEANRTTSDVRYQQFDELLSSVSVGRAPIARAAKTTIKALTPRKLRRDALDRAHHLAYRDTTPDEKLMLELRHRFKPEVVALSEYLDRDLVALWGYDKLG